MPDLRTPPRAARVEAGAVLLALLPSLLVALATPAWGAESFARNLQDPLLFRASAELVLQGRSPYDHAQLAGYVAQRFWAAAEPAAVIPFAYPPPALPFLLVHALGSERQGYLCAVLGFGAALVLLQLWAARTLGLALGERVALLLATGWSGAVALNALLGQTGTLIGALVFAYLALLGSAPIWAGAALGLLAIKPQYLLFVGLVPLLERRWKVLAGACASSGLLALLATGWFGAARWGEWFRAALAPNRTLPAMANWSAPLSRFAGVPVATLQAATLWVMLAGLIVLAALLWFAGAHRHALAAGQARLALALAWATFASPNTHPYDLTLWFAALSLLPGRKAVVAFALAGFVWLALAFSLRALLPMAALAIAFAALQTAASEPGH